MHVVWQVRHLGALGEKDVADTTHRILHAVIVNSGAVQMNFAGRGGKLGIENMTLLRWVVGKSYCFLHIGICIWTV